jgi:hypothetical protein
MVKLCTNKNHSYKHNEQINKQNIDNSECFGSKCYRTIDFLLFACKRHVDHSLENKVIYTNTVICQKYSEM